MRQSFSCDKTDICFAHYSLLMNEFEKLYNNHQNMNYMEHPLLNRQLTHKCMAYGDQNYVFPDDENSLSEHNKQSRIKDKIWRQN